MNSTCRYTLLLTLEQGRIIYRIYIIPTYINTKMCVCLSVCVCFRVFLDHFETDWESLWHKAAFCFWPGSKTIIFFLKLFFAELLPFFYISLRFLCKFRDVHTVLLSLDTRPRP